MGHDDHSSGHDARGTQPAARGPKSMAPHDPKSSTPSGGSATVTRRPPVKNISHLSPYQISRLPVKKPITREWRLSPLELAFVSNYIGISKFNATDAFRRAHGTALDANVGSEPSRWMGRPRIHRAIQAAMDQRAAKLSLSAERVLLEVMRIAFVDPVDFFDENGDMKKMHEIPEDARRAISAMDIESTKLGTKKTIKTTDKLKALELLGRHLKLFKDSITINVTFEQMVLASMEEAKQLPEGSNIHEVNEAPQEVPEVIEELEEGEVVPDEEEIVEEIPEEVPSEIEDE